MIPRILAIGDINLPGGALDANPDLQGIAVAPSHAGDWVGVAAATERGIPVTKLSCDPVVMLKPDLTNREVYQRPLKVRE